MFITLTDFHDSRYVVEVEDMDEATAASLPVKVTPGIALKRLRDKIVKGEPIECEIVHSNNHAKGLTIFHGPVTLTYHYERDTN